jgi:hypothetical protein
MARLKRSVCYKPCYFCKENSGVVAILCKAKDCKTVVFNVCNDCSEFTLDNDRVRCLLHKPE